MGKRNIFIGIFFAFLAVVVTFPAILHLSDKMIGDMGDGYQFIGFQYIAKKLFFAGEFPFGWTSFWRYPYGVDFQNIYDSSLLILFGILFYQITSNPILVYNLSVFGFIILGLAVSYYSFSFYFRPLVALIGAVLYGLTFMSIARLGGHINLYLIPSFLLFFTSLHLILKENGSKKSFMRLGMATLLAAFASLQFPLFILGGLPIIGIVTLLFYKQESIEFIKLLWSKRVYVLACLACILSGFWFFHGNKLIGFVDKTVQMPVAEITSVPLVNFFVPNVYLRSVLAFITNNTKEWIEYVTFFGYVELALLVLVLFSGKVKRAGWYFITLAFIFFIITLGVQPFLTKLWPYQYLFPYFPYRGIIEPGRFAALSYLASIFLILIFISHIKNKIVLFGILLLLVFERLPMNFQLSPTQYSSPFISVLKKSPSRAILHLPLYVDWWNGQLYDMYSVYSDKAMANGYVQWSGNTPQAQTLTKKLEEYTCYYEPEYAPTDFSYNEAVEKKNFLLTLLKEYDIRTVVINNDLYLSTDHCTRARQYIDVLFEDADRWQTVFDDGDKKVMYLTR